MLDMRYGCEALQSNGLESEVMKVSLGNVRLSASDLSNHLACNHLTTLDLDVATGSRSAPKWNSPDAWVLQQRGIEHEIAYIRHLESQGLSVVNFRDTGDEKSAFEKTCAAMQSGVDVIVQAVLAEGIWFGRADVLRRVVLPSKLGNWSYEVYDCKLALETKAGSVGSSRVDLQACKLEYSIVSPK